MITRAQMPRQLRGKGGITNVVPRTNYIFGGIKDRIRKLIPNELADVAVKAAPFVAPFNAPVAALMRGIGRFDQRGSISDAVKQGLGTFAFGKVAQQIPGTQDYFGKGMEGAKALAGDIRTKAGGLFEGGGDIPTVGKEKTGPLKNVAEKVFENVPFSDKIPTKVKEKLLVGGIITGGKTIYDYYTGAFGPQEPGESLEEYMARRRESVKLQTRQFMDSYYTPLRNPQYAAMSDEEKDKFIDSIVGQGMAMGGRAGYQTGGITMANTLAENMRRNVANQAAINKVFQAAASRAFPEGNFQQIRASSPTQKDYNIRATEDLVKNLPGGIIRDAIAPAAAGVMSLPYDAIQAATRIKESDIDRAMQTAGMSGPKDIMAEAEGLAYARENPLSSAAERSVGAAGPLAERLSQPNIIDVGSDPLAEEIPGAINSLVNVNKQPTSDVSTVSQEGVIPGFTKISGDKFYGVPEGTGAGTGMEFMYRGPDGQIYGSETYSSIAAGQYPDIYNPNRKLPVEPQTDQDLIEGFAKFKEQNPEVMQGAGMAALVEGVLPGGAPITFSGSVESNAFNKYLESLGLSRADIVKPRENIESLLKSAKLAKGGMPTGIMRANKAGVMERDYRDKGGFVPVGIKEKADDVPAMLSKNEFVFTADAVRGAVNGSIEKGAQRMYDTMKNLEKRVT